MISVIDDPNHLNLPQQTIQTTPKLKKPVKIIVVNAAAKAAIIPSSKAAVFSVESLK
jgi:hypothetical protein